MFLFYAYMQKNSKFAYLSSRKLDKSLSVPGEKMTLVRLSTEYVCAFIEIYNCIYILIEAIRGVIV